MKTTVLNYLLALMAAIVLAPSSGQAQLNYSFTATGGTFTAITGATTVVAANVDEGLSSAQNIGFTFNYGCNSYTQFKASSNGWISLGTAATGALYTNSLATTGSGPIITPLWDDLATTASTGKVSFVTTGSAPNRILTVEWFNMKWGYNAAGARINFQVKLYETTNVIEFIYFGVSGSLSSPSATIGISGGSSATDFYSLSASSGSPTANYGTATNNIATRPADNQLYRFTPVDMTYTSSTVTQNSTSVSKCDINQHVVGVQIVIGGGCNNQLSLTQLLVNMTGSTIAGTNTNDVTKIRVYYTGTSSNFMPIAEYVSGGTTPNTGTITINGSQTLQAGTNYFWIAYDINSASATVSNVVDAQCTQLTIGGVNRTPTVTAPAGSRTISTCTVSPGGTAGALAFWVKANTGTSTTTNGTTFTTWNDQSGNARNAVAPTGAQSPTFYDNSTNNINFNPVVDFDDASQSTTNGDYMDIAANNILASNNNPYVAYFVLKPGTANNTTPGKFLFSGSTGTSNFNAFDIRSGYSFNDSWNNNDMILGGLWSPNNMVMATFNYNSTQRELYVGGAAAGSQSGNIRTSTNLNSAIGVQRAAGTLMEYYDGSIAEIITYPNTTHSQDSRYRVESYLAIKYGITLPHNYISSLGVTVWNLTQNASYNNNIRGIGRDDNSALSQKQSKSSSATTDMVSLYVGPTKQTNQSNNTGSFTSGDQSYFIVGNNSDPYTFAWSTPEKPATIVNRLRREWMAQKTNFTNTDLKLEFDFNLIAPGYSALIAADLRLLVDADGDFTNATILGSPTVTISVSSGVVTVTVPASNFDATNYFTLGSVANTTPLPVQFNYLTAECEKDHVQINWIATEDEFHNYNIERSSNGLDFKPVHTAQSTSGSGFNYFWKDQDPLGGLSYYRIRAVDRTGKTTYSRIAMVKDCRPDHSYVSLNSKNGTTLHLRLQNDAMVEINFYDGSGRSINIPSLSGKKQLHQGIHQLNLNDNSLPKGMYLIAVNINGNTVMHKVVN